MEPRKDWFTDRHRHWHEFCLCSITQFTWNKWVSFNLRICTLQSDFLRNIQSHSIRSCTIFGANSPHNHKCRGQWAASSIGERFPGSWHASACVMGMEPVPFHDVAFHNSHLHTDKRWAVVRIYIGCISWRERPEMRTKPVSPTPIHLLIQWMSMAKPRHARLSIKFKLLTPLAHSGCHQ